MRLIVITPSSTKENEQTILKEMLNMGLLNLHVRKPHYSTESLREYLDFFTEDQQKCIVIHSHHRLLWNYGLKGIHFTRLHKKKPYRSWFTQRLINIKRSNIIKSTSCNNLSALAEYNNIFGYIMLTPVFAETLHNPTFSLGTLNAITNKYPGKIVARGGANLESVSKAHELGFTGIVFQNYLWKSPDPLEQFRKIINRFHELGIPIE